MIPFLHLTPLVNEVWVRIQGWYRDATNFQTFHPTCVIFKMMTSNRATLYWRVPPRDGKSLVDDSITQD